MNDERLIPDIFGNELKQAARGRTALKLSAYLKVRDFYEENLERIESVGVMKFYSEVADWMNVSIPAVRKNMSAIGNWTDAELINFINADLSFDHIITARQLENRRDCPHDARTLLNAAIDNGGESGARMTVEEMTAFALGEAVPPPLSEYNERAARTLSNMIKKIPQANGWNESRAKKFAEVIDAIIKEYLQ